MRSTSFLALITVLSVTAAMAQPDEAVAPEDSLQVTEETEPIPEVPADSTETTPETAEEEVPVDPDVTEEVTVEDEEPVVPSQPTAVLQAFFQALRTGDSYMISQLISDDGLESVDVMLEILKESLDDDQEAVMTRLSSAGYSATADEVEDWSAMEYLMATVELPVMKSRYAMYEMQISDFAVSGDRLQVPITFITASGVELPFQAEMMKVRDNWKVSTFMGLSSFP